MTLLSKNLISLLTCFSLVVSSWQPLHAEGFCDCSDDPSMDNWLLGGSILVAGIAGAVASTNTNNGKKGKKGHAGALGRQGQGGVTGPQGSIFDTTTGETLTVQFTEMSVLAISGVAILNFYVTDSTGRTFYSAQNPIILTSTGSIPSLNISVPGVFGRYIVGFEVELTPGGSLNLSVVPVVRTSSKDIQLILGFFNLLFTQPKQQFDLDVVFTPTVP